MESLHKSFLVLLVMFAMVFNVSIFSGEPIRIRQYGKENKKGLLFLSIASASVLAYLIVNKYFNFHKEKNGGEPGNISIGKGKTKKRKKRSKRYDSDSGSSDSPSDVEDSFNGKIGFDLRLDEKPSTVKTYDWCTKIAHDNVMEKKDAVLRFLGINTPSEWLQIKKRLEPGARNAILKVKKNITNDKPLSKKTKQRIYDVLQKPLIKKKLHIIRVGENHGRIVATISNGEKIQFAQQKNKKLFKKSPAAVLGDIVFIRERQSAKSISCDKVEGIIGHELGHMLQQHSFESYCILMMFLQKGLCAFKNNLYWQFKKAQEIEADIVGVFDDYALAKSLRLLFFRLHRCKKRKKLFKKRKKLFKRHPADLERANYLKKICKSMKNEQKLNISHKKPQIVFFSN